MFDWPDAIQTSPVSTSVILISFLPFTTSSSGVPLAAGVAILTSHLPSAPALVAALASPSVTVTSSSGAAVPQTAASVFCCKTMWSPKICGSFTSAWAEAAATHSQARKQTNQAFHAEKLLG